MVPVRSFPLMLKHRNTETSTVYGPYATRARNRTLLSQTGPNTEHSIEHYAMQQYIQMPSHNKELRK